MAVYFTTRMSCLSRQKSMVLGSAPRRNALPTSFAFKTASTLLKRPVPRRAGLWAFFSKTIFRFGSILLMMVVLLCSFCWNNRPSITVQCMLRVARAQPPQKVQRYAVCALPYRREFRLLPLVFRITPIASVLFVDAEWNSRHERITHDLRDHLSIFLASNRMREFIVHL